MILTIIGMPLTGACLAGLPRARREDLDKEVTVALAAKAEACRTWLKPGEIQRFPTSNTGLPLKGVRAPLKEFGVLLGLIKGRFRIDMIMYLEAHGT